MQMFHRKQNGISKIVVGSVLAASILIMDLSLPLGIAGGVPYVVLVCLGAWFSKPIHIVFLAFVSTALTAFGYFFSEPGGEEWVVLVNRGLALFAIWTTAFLLIHIKYTGASLAESEERFRSFAELGADWFWEMDENLRFTFVSERFREITGRNPEVVYGQERSVFIDPLLENKNSRKWKEHLSKLKAHKPFREFNYQLRAADGRIIQATLSGNPIFSDEGKFLGYGGTGSDITERTEAENALRESEERYKNIIELTSDQIWEMDENFKFTYFSDPFDPASPFASNQFVGKTRWDGTALDIASNEKWLKHREDHIAHRSYSNFEYSMTDKEGVIRTVTVSGFPVFDKKGNFNGYLGTARDITERKHLEEQVRRSQKMEAIGQLTGGIAHDFNNLLGIVMGNLEVIQDVVANDSNASKHVQNALNGVDRGADITRKLLGFSRKDSTETQIVNINDSLNNLLGLITKSLTVSIDVKTQFSDDLWTVEIDLGDFEDTILNLVLNARDAMPRNGILTIKTSNKVLDEEFVKHNAKAVAGSYIQVSIRDTGTGMSNEIVDKVFEPFFTTKDKSKGTGLGLSMVYGFVERSGGFITIESEVGKGTAFQLYIPREIEDEISVDEPEVTADNLPRGREKILIVDDEEGLRDIATFNLGELGYKALGAKDGPGALKMLEKERDIDLLFSDVILPNFLSGFELARKAHESYPQLKILLTSGYDKKLSKAEINNAPFLMSLHKTQLTKPYTISELAIAIRKALDEKL